MGDDLTRMRMEFHGYCPITVCQKCFEYSRFDGASPHHLMLNTDSHPIIVQAAIESTSLPGLIRSVQDGSRANRFSTRDFSLHPILVHGFCS
jgi:hypothetical protein